MERDCSQCIHPANKESHFEFADLKKQVHTHNDDDDHVTHPQSNRLWMVFCARKRNSNHHNGKKEGSKKTYLIAISCPWHHIPFDCYVSGWVQRIEGSCHKKQTHDKGKKITFLFLPLLEKTLGSNKGFFFDIAKDRQLIIIEEAAAAATRLFWNLRPSGGWEGRGGSWQQEDVVTAEGLTSIRKNGSNKEECGKCNQTQTPRRLCHRRVVSRFLLLLLLPGQELALKAISSVRIHAASWNTTSNSFFYSAMLTEAVTVVAHSHTTHSLPLRPHFLLHDRPPP